jgi:hypothetical protein
MSKPDRHRATGAPAVGASPKRREARPGPSGIESRQQASGADVRFRPVRTAQSGSPVATAGLVCSIGVSSRRPSECRSIFPHGGGRRTDPTFDGVREVREVHSAASPSCSGATSGGLSLLMLALLPLGPARRAIVGRHCVGAFAAWRLWFAVAAAFGRQSDDHVCSQRRRRIIIRLDRLPLRSREHERLERQQLRRHALCQFAAFRRLMIGMCELENVGQQLRSQMIVSSSSVLAMPAK